MPSFAIGFLGLLPLLLLSSVGQANWEELLRRNPEPTGTELAEALRTLRASDTPQVHSNHILIAFDRTLAALSKDLDRIDVNVVYAREKHVAKLFAYSIEWSIETNPILAQLLIKKLVAVNKPKGGVARILKRFGREELPSLTTAPQVLRFLDQSLREKVWTPAGREAMAEVILNHAAQLPGVTLLATQHAPKWQKKALGILCPKTPER